METSVDNIEQNSKVESKPAAISGVAYPYEPIDSAIENIQKFVSEHGTSVPISKDKIAQTLGKTPGSVSLYCSTWVQYGLLDSVFGKGYLPTLLYHTHLEPVYEGDEEKSKLIIFSNPPLYKLIIEQLEGKLLPPEDKFPIILKNSPFNVNPNAADRAARVFFENAKSLRLLDGKNKFTYHRTPLAVKHDVKVEEVKHVEPKIKDEEDGLFKLPIPLGGRRKAFISYPLDDLNRKDIRIIVKALAFIASSIEGEEDDEFEIEIKTRKEQS